MQTHLLMNKQRTVNFQHISQVYNVNTQIVKYIIDHIDKTIRTAQTTQFPMRVFISLKPICGGGQLCIHNTTHTSSINCSVSYYYTVSRQVCCFDGIILI